MDLDQLEVIKKKLQALEKKATELVKGLPVFAKTYAPESYQTGLEIVADLKAVNKMIEGEA